MKTLFILRHAEAAPDQGGGDFARVLMDQGSEAARALGALMKEKNYAPAMAACSSAQRTRETLSGILESVKIPVITHHKEIYHAGPEELLQFVRAFDDKYESALVVGHNPTVHELAAMLASDETPQISAELARGYKPGTLTVLSCPGASWKDLQPGENKPVEILRT